MLNIKHDFVKKVDDCQSFILLLAYCSFLPNATVVFVSTKSNKSFSQQIICDFEFPHIIIGLAHKFVRHSDKYINNACHDN
jgi:hypothetical protein